MLGEEGTGFFGRVALAAGCLGEGAVKVRVDGFFVAKKPVFLYCLGLDEIEGVGEQLGGFAEGSAVELLLDALFDGWIEGDSHRMSIRRESGGGKLFLLRPADFTLAYGGAAGLTLVYDVRLA
jgi:hypothetical protein